MYKRSNGIYYTDFKGRDGKPVRLTTGTGNEREAKTKAKELEEQYWSGVLPVKGSQKPNGMTLKEGFDKAFRTVWTVDKNYSQRGIDTYWTDSRDVMEILGEIVFEDPALGGNVLIKEIKKGTINSLKEALFDRDYAVATVRNKMACLSSLLSLAVDPWEEIEARPKFKWDKPDNERIRIFTEEEETEMLVWAKKNDIILHDLLIVLFDTGCRLSEALNLEKNRISIANKNVRFVKTKTDRLGRTVHMTDRVVEVFSKEERANGFESTKDQIQPRFHRLKVELGYKDDHEYVMHVCRHTCATRWIEDGNPIKTVQALLGHKRIETTMRYVKNTASQFEEVRKRQNQRISTVKRLKAV